MQGKLKVSTLHYENKKAREPSLRGVYNRTQIPSLNNKCN